MIKLRFFFEEVDNLLFVIYKNVIVTLNQERQLLIMIMIIIIMLIIMIIILTMIMKGGAVMARVDWHWNSLPSPSPGGTDDNGS